MKTLTKTFKTDRDRNPYTDAHPEPTGIPEPHAGAIILLPTGTRPQDITPDELHELFIKQYKP